MTHLRVQALRRFRSISCSSRILSAQLGRLVSLPTSTLPCAITTFFASFASLFLVKSSCVYLFFPSRGHIPPSILRDRLNPHPCLRCGRFPVPRYAKRPSVALYAIDPLFSFPPRPLRTAPSSSPKTTRFGSRPPLIQLNAPAHRSLLVLNFISVFSHHHGPRYFDFPYFCTKCVALRNLDYLLIKTGWSVIFPVFC